MRYAKPFNLKRTIGKYFIPISFLFSVFHYYSAGPVRLVLLAPLLILIIMMSGLSGRVKKPGTVALYLPMLFFLFVSFLVTGESAVLSASAMFLILFSWPVFLSDSFITSINIDLLKKSYFFSAMLIALGLILQYVLFSFFGYSFGRIEAFKNRIAFSFLWADFSLISLFMLSAIPFSFLFRQTFRYFFIGTLVVAALISTGRTGIFAAFVVLVIYFLGRYYKSVLSGKIKLIYLILPLFVLAAPVGVYFLNRFIGTRNLRFDSAGRFETYIDAWNAYTGSNVWFGRFFDVQFYGEAVSTAPHNLFLYFILFGGPAFLILFLAWFCLIYAEFHQSSDDLYYAMLIVMIGTMFIPSFFSMYFFALLISIVIFSNLQTKSVKTREAVPVTKRIKAGST